MTVRQIGCTTHNDAASVRWQKQRSHTGSSAIAGNGWPRRRFTERGCGGDARGCGSSEAQTAAGGASLAASTAGCSPLSGAAWAACGPAMGERSACGAPAQAEPTIATPA